MSSENSELEIAAGCRAARSAVGPGRRQNARRQQSGDAAQVFPRCFRQCRIRADEVANHLPRRQIQRALGRRSHRQRNRALRAETNPLRRRFLPRSNADGLREHINRYRFASRFQLTAASKTVLVVHRSLRLAMFGQDKILS